MKKITLTLAAIAAAITMNAQTTYFSDDFNDEDVSDWTLIDEDGDGINWSAVQIVDEEDQPVGTPVLRSASWNSVLGPLTPDNYAFSMPIDLSSEDGTNDITLSWDVAAADAGYTDENYTVYVATGNTVADAMSATVSFNELVSDNGAGGLENFYTKTLDITSLAGQVVYVAFRHHDVSDQFTMEIDNVEVVAGSLAVDNTSFESFNHYVANNVLTLKANTAINNARLYNILGQQVISKKLGTQSADINLNALNSGVYLVQVEIEGQSKSFKIVKK
ncbi:putative secreted protein (Por secretion system target) [Mesonia algae]|uniref:Putative secreted protein (Por secretion system target) n=1 Tax=Mesonia algae TaxID=213248 RepID=A0A2W7I8N5_9FLAO|nr:choice-of-anchor J domain-containing protein [Mesonia algae]PZW41425.1 putative secreted protein (Por secretion system target) [Mesonia algae]